jgi:hypothetical protein
MLAAKAVSQFNKDGYSVIPSVIDAVLIVVDSESLETRCRFWLKNNRE